MLTHAVLVPPSSPSIPQAIRSDNPIIFFEHVLLYNIKGDAGGADEYQSLERAEIVRSGTDCVIFTYSRMRYVVMQAVAELEKKGYNPEVGVGKGLGGEGGGEGALARGRNQGLCYCGERRGGYSRTMASREWTQSWGEDNQVGMSIGNWHWSPWRMGPTKIDVSFNLRVGGKAQGS